MSEAQRTTIDQAEVDRFSAMAAECAERLITPAITAAARPREIFDMPSFITPSYVVFVLGILGRQESL